jgi:conjugal transfer pilus assembly protein TraK
VHGCRGRALLLALSLLAATTLPALADGRPEVELPVVPASVDPRGRKAAATPSLAEGTITVAPGETKALVVSAGNVNRIVTPFAQPDIVTAAPDQFTIRQNVVYAAPAAPAPGQQPEPLTLYLTEKGDETTAISLILLPRLQVASREFRLVLAGGHGGTVRVAASSRKAAAWEQDQPYPAMLAELLARLAAGSVPQGYDLGPPDPAAAPRCAAPASLRVDFGHGQLLTGGQLEAWVGTVVNTGTTAAELAETACALTTDVAAVALWPSPRLAPGELAEIYVVRRLLPPAERTHPRPSLIGWAP